MNDERVTVIEIASFLRASIELRQSYLDEDCVAYYMDNFDTLEPVLVYENEGGRILVAGHHREAAARRLGRTAIRAIVRPGTRMMATLFRDHPHTRWLERSEQEDVPGGPR